MKKNLIALSIALLTFSTASAQEDWANFGRYSEANAGARRGAAAVFMGNSITQGWVETHPQFFTENDYIGRGISGQTTSKMLVRFRPDVIALAPKCVVILAGTNDIAGNLGDISLENICGNIISMAELAKYNGIEVVICSVLPAYDYPWRPGREPAEKILALNAMLREYVENKGCIYADVHSAMKDDRNGLPAEYSHDGVHLNATGYTKMESVVKPLIDKAINGN
ncbi:MAG: GDSL-type esterase/lipase family protein [Alistipes sp.]|nr:GDSL-type esterase/lipase family protein [Alistipes sp.]